MVIWTGLSTAAGCIKAVNIGATVNEVDKSCLNSYQYKHHIFRQYTKVSFAIYRHVRQL
jgi:hypothetical protein